MSRQANGLTVKDRTKSIKTRSHGYRCKSWFRLDSIFPSVHIYSSARIFLLNEIGYSNINGTGVRPLRSLRKFCESILRSWRSGVVLEGRMYKAGVEEGLRLFPHFQLLDQPRRISPLLPT